MFAKLRRQRWLCRLGFHYWHYSDCKHRWCKLCTAQQYWEFYDAWQDDGHWKAEPFWVKRYYYGRSGAFKPLEDYLPK